MENINCLTLTIAEVCETLNVSRPTVTAWIRRRDNPLPCIKASKTYRIPRAALEQWIIDEAKRNSGIAR